MKREVVNKTIARIKLEAIDQEKLHKGAKGTYLNIEIIEYDSEDKVGNTDGIYQEDVQGLLGGGKDVIHEPRTNVLDELIGDNTEDDGSLSKSSLNWDLYD